MNEHHSPPCHSQLSGHSDRTPLPAVSMGTFGDVVREIGEFGPFQKRLLFVLCLPCLFTAFETIGQVFVGTSFPHHCNTDWILDRGNLTEEHRKNLTLPANADGEFESCRMFTPVDWDLGAIEAYGLNSTSECLHGWDYDAPEGASTIVTEVRAAGNLQERGCRDGAEFQLSYRPSFCVLSPSSNWCVSRRIWWRCRSRCTWQVT